MLRSRRLAFAAAALLVGLSACGDSSPRTVDGRSPIVIQMGGAHSTAAGAEPASADKMMASMQDVTFVFDGDASTLAASGSAWSLPGGTTPDTARIAKLAELLGVKGDLRELSADQGGGWMIGADDYSTATLTVSLDGMVSWWFNPAPSTVASSNDCVYVDPAIDVVPVDSSDAATTVGGDAVAAPPDGSCAAPLPPANVPDKAAAEEKAKQLFADMGYDNSGYDYEVYADEWGANVTAYLLLDGMRSPISLSVGYGADSEVTWASGSLATPVPAGEYPLVGVDGGVVRLNDETGQWGGYWGGPMARMESAGSGSVVADSATAAVVDASTEVVAVPQPTEPAETAITETGQVGEPITIEQPALEPVTIHLTDVKMGLTMIWAADNTIWLLPAYEFGSADGGMYTVIAVDDSFIQLPAPYPIDTMPVDTVIPDGTGVPSDVGDSTIVDNSPAVAEEAGKSIVGLPIDEATKVAEAAGFTVRVSTLDGVPQAVTADFLPNRLNASVENGVVVAIDNIG